MSTTPKPLIPGPPDWVTNATGWLWFVAVAGAVWILYKSRGKSD